MKQAHLSANNRVTQVVPFVWDERHPGTGLTFVDCPEHVEPGYTYDPQADSWTAPPEPDPAPAPEPQPRKLTPIQFKLLFTSQERVAIKASSDPVIVDFLEIINDPQLQEVELGDSFTTDGLNYLEAQGLIASGRAAEILET